jgi:hypothetical protein
LSTRLISQDSHPRIYRKKNNGRMNRYLTLEKILKKELMWEKGERKVRKGETKTEDSRF